jgi:2'-5' RNA ligase
MRSFVAIGAEGLKIDLTYLKDLLSSNQLEYNFIPESNHHITLCFLGNIEEEQIPQVRRILQEVASEHDSFRLRLSGIKAFPDETNARVIWIGLQNSLVLRSLQGECVRKLNDIGLNLEEKEFIPHLSVARLYKNANLTDILSQFKHQEFCEIKVEKIELYKSELTEKTPVYHSLLQCYLGQRL